MLIEILLVGIRFTGAVAVALLASAMMMVIYDEVLKYPDRLREERPGVWIGIAFLLVNIAWCALAAWSLSVGELPWEALYP